MAYCNLVDIKNYTPEQWLQQLSDDNDMDSIDVEKVNDCIRRADDLIDSFIRGRYDLPLSTVPSLIRDLSIKISVYNLFKRSLIVTMPEPITEDYKDSVSILGKIQKGQVTPFANTPGQEEPAFFASNKTTANNKVFPQSSAQEQFDFDGYFY